MPDRKVVLTEDAQRFASQMGIQLFETSAKDNKNVEEMFNAITQQVLLTKKEQKEQASNLNDTITVGKGRKPTKKSKCCWKVIFSWCYYLELFQQSIKFSVGPSPLFLGGTNAQIGSCCDAKSLVYDKVLPDTPTLIRWDRGIQKQKLVSLCHPPLFYSRIWFHLTCFFLFFFFIFACS